eukprot:2071979-Amphidinium_carterae.3
MHYMDENVLTSAQELHEGVLYYMSRKMEAHYTDMNFLEQSVQKQLEGNQGEVEENEEFITALDNKDDAKLKERSYKYFGELRRQWKISKTKEDNRKKEDIRKALQREEEDRQNKKRERDEQEAATATSTMSSSSEYGTKEAYATSTIPTESTAGEYYRQQEVLKKTPATPSVPVLSPRLRLDSHNSKIRSDKKTDAYY